MHALAPASTANLGPASTAPRPRSSSGTSSWSRSRTAVRVEIEGEGAAELPRDATHLTLRAFALFAPVDALPLQLRQPHSARARPRLERGGDRARPRRRQRRRRARRRRSRRAARRTPCASKVTPTTSRPRCSAASASRGGANGDVPRSSHRRRPAARVRPRRPGRAHEHRAHRATACPRPSRTRMPRRTRASPRCSAPPSPRATRSSCAPPSTTGCTSSTARRRAAARGGPCERHRRRRRRDALGLRPVGRRLGRARPRRATSPAALRASLPDDTRVLPLRVAQRGARLA